jgi:hypothetical protein
LYFWSALQELWSHGPHGDREGAPLVVLALLLVGVVTLDALGRGVVAVVRRLISEGAPRRHS